MVNTITLKEALVIMRGGRRFDIEVCTADGDRSVYAGAMLANAFNVTAGAAEHGKETAAKNNTNPMHAAHGTVNIRLNNNEVRKIYPVLIERFNNKSMII